MIAGDSYLERKLDVAPDFPKTILKRGETITTDDVMYILGLQEGDYLEASVSLYSSQITPRYSTIFSKSFPLTSKSSRSLCLNLTNTRVLPKTKLKPSLSFTSFHWTSPFQPRRSTS